MATNTTSESCERRPLITLEEILQGDWPKLEEWNRQLIAVYAHFLAETKEPEYAADMRQLMAAIFIMRIPEPVCKRIFNLAHREHFKLVAIPTPEPVLTLVASN